MTEWTLVTIPTTSIGEMKLAPNMLLVFVGLGIRRLAPSGLLGFAFPLGMGFGFALRKYRSLLGLWCAALALGPGHAVKAAVKKVRWRKK